MTIGSMLNAGIRGIGCIGTRLYTPCTAFGRTINCRTPVIQRMAVSSMSTRSFIGDVFDGWVARTVKKIDDTSKRFSTNIDKRMENSKKIEAIETKWKENEAKIISLGQEMSSISSKIDMIRENSSTLQTEKIILLKENAYLQKQIHKDLAFLQDWKRGRNLLD